MNIELIRLGTFVSWPADAPVTARELSRCGFFVADSRTLLAECAWCHCQISDWQEGDEVWRKHRAASPQCQFLTDYNKCENIALPLFGTEGTSLDAEEFAGHLPSPSEMSDGIDKSLYLEANRLATFKNWPVRKDCNSPMILFVEAERPGTVASFMVLSLQNPNVTPESLAKVGFYYRNCSDEVKCVWCAGVVAQWEKNDNAFEEHKKFFPKCPRTKFGPLIEIGPEGIESLGIQDVSIPRNPKYATLHSRLSTFTDWPIPDIQKPEDLAKAGLYSDRLRDLVRCFHCNIGLRCWEKQDNPWFEHARWSPNCGFVRIMKGNSYIAYVQNSMKILTPNKILEKAMQSGPVRQALQLSIDYNVIREHMCRHMQRTGLAFSSIEELIQEIFDSEEDDEKNKADELNGEEGPGEGTQARIAAIASLSPEEAAASPFTASAAEPSATASNSTLESDSSTPASTSTTTCTSARAPGATSTEPLEEPSTSSALPAATAASGEPTATTSAVSRDSLLEEENRKLRDEFLCKVCFDEVVNVVYLPCGHLATCVQCASGVTQCPMCRSEIKGYVRTFLS